MLPLHSGHCFPAVQRHFPFTRSCLLVISLISWGNRVTEKIMSMPVLWRFFSRFSFKLFESYILLRHSYFLSLWPSCIWTGFHPQCPAAHQSSHPQQHCSDLFSLLETAANGSKNKMTMECHFILLPKHNSLFLLPFVENIFFTEMSISCIFGKKISRCGCGFFLIIMIFVSFF